MQTIIKVNDLFKPEVMLEKMEFMLTQIMVFTENYT